MKIIATILLVMVSGLSAIGQVLTTNIPAATNVPVPAAEMFPAIPGINLDFLTNLPMAKTFQSAKFAVGTAVVTRSGEVENALDLSFYFHTNIMVTTELQLSSSTAFAVNSGTLMGGYRHAWNQADAYALVGARRTWETTSGSPAWQGILLFGASARPVTGSPAIVVGEIGLLTSPTGPVSSSKPVPEIRFGAQLKF